MAYERNGDSKPSFPLGRFTGEGNMVDDPRDIGREKPVAAFKVAFSSRDYKGHEDTLFASVTANGTTADRVLKDGKKGLRVIVEGQLYKNESWENKDGDLVEAFSISADNVGLSWRFVDRDRGERGSSRRDDDDEPRGGRSARSSRRGGDEDGGDDEPRSARSRRTSRDEEDEPRSRTGRAARGRDGGDDEPRAGRSRRSRVEDSGDSVED